MNKTSDSAWVDRLVSESFNSPVPASAEPRLRNAIRARRHEMRHQMRRRDTSVLTRRRLLGASMAAVAGGIVFGVPLLSRNSSQAWGQVVTQVRQKPWVHLSGVHFNGDPMEFWISFRTGVFAARFGDTEFAHFQRASDSTSCWYRESERLLIEDNYQPMPGEFGHLEHLFDNMSTGAAVSNLSGPDEIISQSRSVLEVEGTQRWQYEFRIRAVDEGHESIFTVLFLVDPISGLPLQWSRLQDSRSLTMQIDYPESGPQSIYDLGVPLDVAREHRTQLQ
ncbi:MAG: hypothetical protein R3C53_03555 [Pirellulaceae bacterium]